jgi:hypothetical protein
MVRTARLAHRVTPEMLAAIDAGARTGDAQQMA